MSACPLPREGYERVVMGHGAGGGLGARLLEEVFLPAFDNPLLAALEDAATLPPFAAGERIAVTTDAFVVRPLFFPGGDIGKLAACGTLNDLAVAGAAPRALTAAFVLEEGLPLADLAAIARSLGATCREAGVRVVAGDTKVVERGKADGLYIATTGVGAVPPGRELGVARARPGDAILVSGPIGDHGIAILSAREGIAFETALASDCALLRPSCERVLAAALGTRCLRDATRGGVSAVCHEIAQASRVSVRLDEAALPIRDEVRGACELLGLDPLYVACEGAFVAVVPESEARAALAALGGAAARIGTVAAERPGMVTVRSLMGGERLARLPSGEQLPRIC